MRGSQPPRVVARRQAARTRVFHIEEVDLVFANGARRTYERIVGSAEGAVLVVDAAQGVQAQTLSNLFLAMEAGLAIVPVLNKIDLGEKVRSADLSGLDAVNTCLPAAPVLTLNHLFFHIRSPANVHRFP